MSILDFNRPTPLPSDIDVAPTSYPLKINGAGQCLSLITGDLLTVFHLGSLTQRFQRSFGRAPILAEVLDKSNIVALVFSSDPTMIYIWDDRQTQMIKEIKSQAPVVNLSFQSEFLFVMTESASLLYRIQDFSLVTKTVTGQNQLGLGQLWVSSAHDYRLVVPGPEPGHILIIQSEFQIDFQAHQNPLTAMTLSTDGRVLATASQRGTIIRLWSLDSIDRRGSAIPALIKEFRRGAEATTIHNLVFHPDPERRILALTGKTKTTHLFSWSEESTSGKTVKAKKSDRGWLNLAWSTVSREIPNYITSQGSQIQIVSPKNCLALFHPEQPELILISPEAKLAKYLYRLEPPETRQILMLQLN